jgi:ribosomal protein S18 acetylase RimI-like enzyme
MQPGPVIRQAVHADLAALSALLENTSYVHRHLDWRPPLEWLGLQPYWLVEQEGTILAALACPPDPPNVAWIRLFAVHPSLTIQTAWEMLFPRLQERFPNETGTNIASIVLYPWFGDLLFRAGFHLHQEIVVLEWDNILPAPITKIPPVTIRNLKPADLAKVAWVDNTAFELLWQNSEESLMLALQQSACATVAEFEGQIVGYQISTASAYSAHLARLAVLPALQKRSIGYLLVRDLLERFSHREIYRVTVNTQGNNHASLALYQKLGFWLTGDRFQVLVYPFN